MIVPSEYLMNLTRHPLLSSLAGIVMHDHASAGLGKPPGDTLPQAATSPGNHRDLASKIEEIFNGWELNSDRFHLILHDSSFNIAAQRLAVGFICWLDARAKISESVSKSLSYYSRTGV
jgi:hypothetical protein